MGRRTTSSLTIQGNYIGVDANGNTALSNSGWGVRIESSGVSNVQIGGQAAGTGNVISGNGTTAGGILVHSGTGAVIEGNRIGVGSSSTSALGTIQQVGVSIGGASSGTRIGGTNAASANLISRNGSLGGVRIEAGSTGNTIQGNSIHSNTGLGIDLVRAAIQFQASPPTMEPQRLAKPTCSWTRQS